MPEIRPASEPDVAAICRFDEVATTDDGARREFITQSVAAGHCHVLVADGQIVAYGVLEYSFYTCGFIALLYVAAHARRRAYATMLLRHMEALCRTPKLFTSTNLSNLPMQALLAQLGYALSGVVHNLDERDPELIYFKRLR
ncbi:MAG TPA: GNAT family N-acetyltransferase [Pyrinomonadaceae bacterium]